MATQPKRIQGAGQSAEEQEDSSRRRQSPEGGE